MTIEQGTIANDAGVAEASSPAVRILDSLERLIVLGFYLQLLARMLWSFYQYGNPAALLILPSEGLILVLLVIRRRANTLSMRWRDWVAAVCGTVLPTFVVAGSDPASVVPLQVAAFLVLCGLVVQLHAKLSLGRSIGVVAANRGIKCSGPYRFVRHPMYAGYMLGQLGFLAMFPSLWNVSVLSAALAFQLYRILVEEKLLSVDERYVQYKQQVRYRLIPILF